MNPLLCLALAGSACGVDIPVNTSAQFATALLDAEPGDRILMAPGTYHGNFFVRGLHGTAAAPIVITAAAPANPPVLRPDYTGLQLSGASHVEISNLVIDGFSENGLNIDDDGLIDQPSHHIVLRNLSIRGSGNGGNSDCIKLAGVTDVQVLNSTVERYGYWGSGVDMVGCHRVLIRGCLMQTGGFNGVQAKGGSSDVRVTGCRFLNAGQRGVQAGGSTEHPYFRPALSAIPPGQRAEVYRMTIEGNLFVGGDAAVACCTADGVVVRQNTVYRPNKYFLRILQETTDSTFAPCRNASVSDNIVVFRSANWWTGGLNIGVLTAPQTFVFARNAWYCEDVPGFSAPTLPTQEVRGLIGIDPQFYEPAAGDFRVRNLRDMARKGYLAYTRDW